jgi:hypothetical protein
LAVHGEIGRLGVDRIYGYESSEQDAPKTMPSRTFPPRARLAFRVGVVVYARLEANSARWERPLREILQAIQTEVLEFACKSPEAGLYSNDPPILRAITLLAEGVDRIFADQALGLGYELCCPMPFAQAEYENDFVAPRASEHRSLGRFRELLNRARDRSRLTAFELDGTGGRREEAYAAARRIVLNQSDLLVVVRDGGDAEGAAVQMLHDALRHSVPVLWIDAPPPHRCWVLRCEDDLTRLNGKDDPAFLLAEKLREIVREEVALPKIKEDGAVNPEQYFKEPKPHFRLAILWKLFRDAVGSFQPRWPSFGVPDFETAVAKDWPVGSGPEPQDVAEWANRRLLPHYAWADKLADSYADAYRSTYVFIYLSAAGAVFLALLPMASGWMEPASKPGTICILGEAVILTAITALISWEKKRKWHKRWITYRLVAEMLRQLRCLIPLGGGRPLSRVPAHLANYGDPNRTWMNWHLRAIARETGIYSARVTPAYVQDCLNYLGGVVGTEQTGQRNFHLTTVSRSKNIAHRLHETAEWLFRVTMGCIAVHLLPVALHLTKWPVSLPPVLDRWLILACATLPAFASALAGINNQSDFGRISKQSRSMADAFKQLEERIAALKKIASLKLADVTPVAAQTTQLMVDEVLDWRVVFIERPPIEP